MATTSITQKIKGRGAVSSPANRFARHHTERFEETHTTSAPATTLLVDHAKTIIARNNSPDVPFDRSINPYKGCEHGCVYCFARPTHAYLDLSPGLDFETQIFYKPEAARLLEQEITNARYQCRPIALGTNTDPYQPIDKQTGLTRELLKVLQKYRHPFTIVTKGAHLARDMDILADMAKDNLCEVMISLTTADSGLKRIMEPRASSAQQRQKQIRQLADAKVPVGVMIAPVIPMINDNELESLLALASKAGASKASYVFLRLPLEVKTLFTDWLNQHFPERAQHVLNLLQQSLGGKLNQSEFGSRMRGEGVFAELIRQRFKAAARKSGLNLCEQAPLNTELFHQARTDLTQKQMSLF